MMGTIRLFAVLCIGFFLFAGCGVPEDGYEDVKDYTEEAENLQEDLEENMDSDF